MRRRTARLHRLLGLALVAPLLVWTATGLLFLVKPGWAGAYELLEAFGDEPLDLLQVVPLAQLELPDEGDVTAVELGSSALGPLYRIHRRVEPKVLLVHANKGVVVSPLDRSSVEALAIEAAARSTAPDRYGSIAQVEMTAGEGIVQFKGGAEVRVGRNDLTLSQRGPDTVWIDRLYELHYLRWTGIAAVDRAFAIGAIAGVWLLAFAGLLLLRRGVPSTAGATSPAPVQPRTSSST